MMRIIEVFVEVFYWLRIMASPLFIGLGVGILIYSFSPNTVSLYLAIGISLIGLILGIVWATKVWKKTGTSNFMSRVNASPELNKKEDNK